MDIKTFFRPFIDLLFYGNFWIAACAMAMAWQTEFLLTGSFRLFPLGTFVFFSTLFLYALHRIVGLEKVEPFLKKYRFSIIYKFRSHIFLYAFLGGLGALYCFFFLSSTNQLLLFLPVILSLGYVLPFKKNKRLRDFHYIKIFLIALVWAVITVLLPVFQQESAALSKHGLLVFMERVLFIFSITLPFDIRDLKVDAHINVKTIPGRIGISNTKSLAGISLLAVCLMAGYNYFDAFYTLSSFIAISISALLSFLLVLYSDKTDHDYFFTGLMDGTMLLQFGLVYFLN